MFSHALIAILDSTIRESWYAQKRFALSHALFVSAKAKRKHDSSRQVNGTRFQHRLFD
jgi:hypothetical protein